MNCSRCNGSGTVTVPDFENSANVEGFGPLPTSKKKPCPECERVKAAVGKEREALALVLEGFAARGQPVYPAQLLKLAESVRRRKD